MAINENKFTKGYFSLPEQVMEYLQKNATRLLEADEEYVIDLFKDLMGYPEDVELDDFEVTMLRELLIHFEGRDNKGIRGVIDGGLATPKTLVAGLPQQEIRGVISDIIFYNSHEDTNISFLNKDKEKITVQGLARYTLDGEEIFVGYVPQLDMVGYFTVDREEERVRIKPVNDTVRYEMMEDIWNILVRKKGELELNGEL